MSTIPIPQGATIGEAPQASAVPIPQGATIGDPGEQPAKRTWLDSAGDFASELWKQVNPVSGVQGAAQATRHPVDTFKNDVNARQQIMDKAEAAFKRGDYGEGLSHALYGIIPMLGPQLDEAGSNFIKGDISKGAGQSVGMGLNLAAPEALKGVKLKVPTGKLPEQIYQSALKPSLTNSTGEIKSMVNTALDNQIPISAEGVGKLQSLAKDLSSAVEAKIQAGSNAGATVNKFKVASRLGDTAQKFATQVNPEADLNAVSNSGNEFLRNQPGQIPALDAQRLKQGTYQQLSSKSYGELGTATEEAQKALARGIKEELEVQFPEIKGLNAQQAKLYGLDEALQRAVRRIDNRDMMSLGGKVAGATGAAAGGAPGALVSFVLHHVVTSPEVQSKLAIILRRAGTSGASLSSATSRVAGYSNALGQAIQGDQGGNQDTSQQ